MNLDINGKSLGQILRHLEANRETKKERAFKGFFVTNQILRKRRPWKRWTGGESWGTAVKIGKEEIGWGDENRNCQRNLGFFGTEREVTTKWFFFFSSPLAKNVFEETNHHVPRRLILSINNIITMIRLRPKHIIRSIKYYFLGLWYSKKITGVHGLMHTEVFHCCNTVSYTHLTLPTICSV